MDWKKLFMVMILFSVLFTLTGCVKTIEEVKNDAYVDKVVTVRGVVGESVKIGSFSGYTLRDDTGSIGVVSTELPKEGTVVTVRGKMQKLFVYFIVTG